MPDSTRPEVGMLARHKKGLDPREVAAVSDDGTQIWLYFLDPTHKFGPYPAKNYTFTKRAT